MAESKRRAEMRQAVAEYEKSGMTRRAFCHQRGITVTTFDYWRRELGGAKPRLVKAELAATESHTDFTLTLANGRRIESPWRFTESALARLIRIAETA